MNYTHYKKKKKMPKIFFSSIKIFQNKAYGSESLYLAKTFFSETNLSFVLKKRFECESVDLLHLWQHTHYFLQFLRVKNVKCSKRNLLT